MPLRSSNVMLPAGARAVTDAGIGHAIHAAAALAAAVNASAAAASAQRHRRRALPAAHRSRCRAIIAGSWRMRPYRLASTVNRPPSLRPLTAGLYISSAYAGGRTNTPGVVARAMYVAP